MRVSFLMGATLAIGVAQTASTGGISGKIINTQGNGVPANVQLQALGSSKNFSKVVSASDGAFSFSGLAAAYRICATPTSPAYIDSCLWRESIPLKVAAGKIASGHKVLVETAGSLQIQIDDPLGLLTQALTARSPGTVAPHLMVGVLTDQKRFISAPITATAATVRKHQLSVPVDRSIHLRLIAHGLTVATTDAPPVNLSGADIPFKVTSGAPNAPLVFTVQRGAN